MLEHMRKLTADLERERYERKKMECFFKEFQQKFSMMYPHQRKSMEMSKGFKSVKRTEDFLYDDNTT